MIPKAPPPARRQRLLASIVEHAQRIPPTILYARAQNNNHLITEAVGLYTAGCLLLDHPQSARWRKLGWRWFTWAILHQIDPDGTYVQQSTNYHRLMLEAALWFFAQARQADQPLPAPVQQRLAVATRWLYAYFDKISGFVPTWDTTTAHIFFPWPPVHSRITVPPSGCRLCLPRRACFTLRPLG